MKLISKYLYIIFCLLLVSCGGPAVITDGENYKDSAGDIVPPAMIFKEVPKYASLPKQVPIQQIVKIGVLLPLSGPQEEIGKQMRDAALKGLYDKLRSLTSQQRIRNPQLIIRDTAGDPKRAAQAAQELLAMKVGIILGPLLADNVKAVAKIAQQQATPIIAFSNNSKVASRGVFVFGFRPKEQVERIANFALRQQIQHFAALAPQNEYARTVVRQFAQVVKTAGYSLQPVNFFAEGSVPPAPVLNRIVNMAAQWGEKRKAIFVPATGKTLHAIANRIMHDKTINPAFVKLLGTGLWDDDSILKIPTMQGAWFATSPPQQSRNFNQDFRAVYGYKPSRLASLAYDAVALATTLALAPRGADFSITTLTNKAGFSGPANGIFRLLPNGLTQRSLAIVEVTPYGFKVIDEAATSFAP